MEYTLKVQTKKSIIIIYFLHRGTCSTDSSRELSVEHVLWNIFRVLFCVHTGGFCSADFVLRNKFCCVSTPTDLFCKTDSRILFCEKLTPCSHQQICFAEKVSQIWSANLICGTCFILCSHQQICFADQIRGSDLRNFIRPCLHWHVELSPRNFLRGTCSANVNAP